MYRAMYSHQSANDAMDIEPPLKYRHVRKIREEIKFTQITDAQIHTSIRQLENLPRACRELVTFPTLTITPAELECKNVEAGFQTAHIVESPKSLSRTTLGVVEFSTHTTSEPAPTIAHSRRASP